MPTPNTSWSAPADSQAWHCVERLVGVADDQPAVDLPLQRLGRVRVGMSSGQYGTPSGWGNVSW